MGYWQEELKRINQVESQGFNPYTESYSTRIGQLSTQTNGNVPPAQESALKQPEITPQANIDPVVVTANQPNQTMSDYFIQSGNDDPFATMSDNGKINLSTLSTGYNVLLNDPNAPYTPQQYIDRVNNEYVQELQNTYGKVNYKVIINPDAILGFNPQEKKEEPKLEFEQQKRSKYKGGNLYFGYELDSSGNRTGEKKTYKDEDSFKDAMAKQLVKEGYKDVNTDNVYDVMKQLRKESEDQLKANKADKKNKQKTGKD